MGRINRFLCPSCRMTWQIQLGHGFRHALLENVLEAFPEDIREKILADTKGESFPSFEFQYQAAACAKCRQVLSVPVIHLHKSGSTDAPACPDCGSPVRIKQEEESLTCPRCGESPLTAQEMGRWD